jgi:hypothetical protein
MHSSASHSLGHPDLQCDGQRITGERLFACAPRSMSTRPSRGTASPRRRKEVSLHYLAGQMLVRYIFLPTTLSANASTPVGVAYPHLTNRGEDRPLVRSGWGGHC